MNSFFIITNKHPNINGILHDKINNLYIKFFDYKIKQYKGYNYSYPISISLGFKPVSIKNELIYITKYNIDDTNTIYTVIDFIIIDKHKITCLDKFEYTVYYNLEKLKPNDKIYFINNNKIIQKIIINIKDNIITFSDNNCIMITTENIYTYYINKYILLSYFINQIKDSSIIFVK